MTKIRALTYDFLNECFDCDEQAGRLAWRLRPLEHFATTRAFNTWNTRFAGKEAAWKMPNGRMMVRINGRSRLVHRIIYAIHNRCDLAEVPPELDHKDVDPENNKVENLRPSTRSQNHMNRHVQSNNTSGYKGVSWHKSVKKWIARIDIGRKRVNIGTFDTKESAIEARKSYQHLHGDFARFSNRSIDGVTA